MSFAEVELAFQIIAQEQNVVSTEIVEINPELGSPEEAQNLCNWARDLVLSVVPTIPKVFSFPTLRKAFSEEWRRSL
jgi:arginase family enzyme